MTKPFDAAELLARVDALLRRLASRPGEGQFQLGFVRVDLAKSQVTRNGQRVYLTGREFQLLRYSVERAGTIIPRDELLRCVWGYDSKTFTRTVDTHVCTIRQNLKRRLIGQL